MDRESHAKGMVSWDVDGQFMTEEDEKDFERFLEALAFFGKLDARQAMGHMKQHIPSVRTKHPFFAIRL